MPKLIVVTDRPEVYTLHPAKPNSKGRVINLTKEEYKEYRDNMQVFQDLQALIIDQLMELKKN